MTQQQEAVVKDILTWVEKYDAFDANHEVKAFEVKELERGIVDVYTETGLKGDEGTAAAVLCRTIRHIFIGKNGGIQAYGRKPKGKEVTLKGWTDVMIHGYLKL